MDKILEEFKNMEEVIKTAQKVKSGEDIIKNKENDVASLYEKMQLKMIGSPDREMVQKEYEQKSEELRKLKELKDAADKKVNASFESQKKNIVEQIDEEISKYVKTKEDRKNAEEARDKEIAQLQKEKEIYTKIALNSKKDIDNLLEKLNNGENVSTDRLADARNEYKANTKKTIDVKNKIEDIKNKEFKSIEENAEEFSDLMYLKTRIAHLTINDINKIKEDEFLKKYGKEAKDEKIENENKESKNVEKTIEDEKTKNDDESKKDEKIEKNETPKKNQKGINEIILDVSNDKIVINGKEKLFYKKEYKNRKQLKNDNDLAINSYFYNSKAIKNIDYALLSTLNKINKNLAMNYLNVIRGGGIAEYGTAEESLARLKNVIEFKYKFDRSSRVFANLKAKRLARAAHKIGLAELEGISEKSFFDNIKETFAKIQNTKLLKGKEEIKTLSSGSENSVKTQKQKTIDLINEDRRKDGVRAAIKIDNENNKLEENAQKMEKETQEMMKDNVKEIINEDNEHGNR